MKGLWLFTQIVAMAGIGIYLWASISSIIKRRKDKRAVINWKDTHNRY